MSEIDTMRKRALALAGCPAPGDARAAARVIGDLCEHVGKLERAVSEIIDQLREVRAEVAALRGSRPPTWQGPA
jgi:hypothetical protein